MAEAPREAQGATASTYEKQHPRINKPDMFIITAFMIGISPQAERPNSFAPESARQGENQSESARQNLVDTPETQGDGQSADYLKDASAQEKPVVQETQGKTTSNVQGDGQSAGYKDASAQEKPVVQETQGKTTTNVQGDGQNDSKDASAQEKPVAQETQQVEVTSVEEHRENQGISEPRKCKKSGAVVVLPNDRALSVDCSQDGVHAAVSALNKFGQERAKGCQVYLSRRPCSYCAKLLVQCEVSKVYYLPIEPELNDREDVQRVDKLFKASSVGLSVFIPKVSKTVIDGVTNRKSPFTGCRDVEAISGYRRKLIEEYWSDDWEKKASEDLEWPAFADKNMQEQTKKDMHNLMDWIAKATVGDVPDREFVEINPKTLKGVPFQTPTGEPTGDQQTFAKESIPNIPTPNEPSWQWHALHMVRMAQMLSQRSDDPSKPVGCILMVHGEVVAIGWNGFPAKALYGEFPRAASTDQAREKKEPYVIHAEQNALLTRNKRNMNHKSSILYSNKIPCVECVPLLIQAGVKNVVVPHEPLENDPENKAFLAALKKEKLKGYWPARQDDVERVRRNLTEN